MIDRNALVKDLLKIYTAEQLAAESSDPECFMGFIEFDRLHNGQTLQDYLDLTDMGWED